MTKSITPKSIVFYADDDPDDLQLVQDSFAQYAKNVEVVTASDGSQALSYLDNLSDLDPTPCLIILDVNMPVFDGKQVLTRLRQKERFEQVPVVLFTTSSQPLDQNFAAKYNAGFITKPLSMHQMEQITDQFIDHCTEEIRKKIRRQIQ
ncbi:MAG TPA: response regulator [Flavisolibacter sp.]|nr:response regulator [Flavisolibacter sp.]